MYNTLEDWDENKETTDGGGCMLDENGNIIIIKGNPKVLSNENIICKSPMTPNKNKDYMSAIFGSITGSDVITTILGWNHFIKKMN